MTTAHSTPPPMKQLLADRVCVRLLRDEELAADVPADVERIFRANPGPITVEDARVAVTLPPGNGPLPWAVFFDAVRAVRAREKWSNDDLVVLLTRRANEHNWFSGGSENEDRTIFIHTEGWTWVTSAPIHALLAYDIVQNVLWRSLTEAGHPVDTFVHPEPLGCIADFCDNKAQFVLKLRTADICEDCLANYERVGASQAILAQAVNVLDHCRSSALSAARYRSTTSYNEWPYPIALTRHKATQARDPLHRLMLLLD